MKFDSKLAIGGGYQVAYSQETPVSCHHHDASNGDERIPIPLRLNKAKSSIT